MNSQSNEKGGPTRKIQPPDGYPPEPGRYLRGNDLSPVAVCVILKWPDDGIPPEIENLVRVGVETGAALSGTLQTENIGIEKMICNLVANPNIRYLIICGPESPGHLTGEAVMALNANGVDGKRRIVGSQALTPFLSNIALESIERFQRQVRIVDLLNEGDPRLLQDAVRACYQEEPVLFQGQQLCDPGAFPAEPLVVPITWRIQKPWAVPQDDKEQAAVERMHALVDRLRRKKE